METSLVHKRKREETGKHAKRYRLNEIAPIEKRFLPTLATDAPPLELNSKRVLQIVKKYYPLGKHVAEQKLRGKLEIVFEDGEYKNLSEICYYSGYYEYPLALFLHVAKHGYFEAMKWIYFEAGCLNVRTSDNVALLQNVKTCRPDVVRWLLDQAEFDREDREVIIRARKLCWSYTRYKYDIMQCRRIYDMLGEILMGPVFD